MNDLFWIFLRYAMIGVGMWLAGKGIIPESQVSGVVDQIINASPAIITAVGVAWGTWVRKGTRAVPLVTAERKDVPTVSAATGATETGASHT